jgi:hypothetical protein
MLDKFSVVCYNAKIVSLAQKQAQAKRQMQRKKCGQTAFYSLALIL